MSAEAERLLSLVTGYWMSQSVYAAVRTGVLDALDDQPRSPEQVARAADCDEAAVSRLLRYLSGLGLVRRDGDNRYTTTDMARLLRHGSDFRDLVLMYGEEFYQAWGQFSVSVSTGRTAFGRVFGIEHFDYFARSQGSARRFDRAMAACAGVVGEELCRVFEFARVSRVIDVGGGNGSLLKEVLRTASATQGVVVDRDHVVAQCARELVGHELADRITAVDADFFESVPSGGDVYVLSRILHDWDDADCVRLLGVCRKAMRTDSELLIVERLLPEDGGTSLASSWDMQMLAITGGRERTRTAYEKLLYEAGFRPGPVRPLALGTSLLVGSLA